MKFRRREVIIQPTHRGLGYEDGEVQLAARRALATMTLEDIPTNRNRLSNEILRDVKEAATTYGFTVLRRREGSRVPRELAGNHESRARGGRHEPRTASARIYIGFDKHCNGQKE